MRLVPYITNTEVTTKATRLAILILILFGTVLRLVQFAANRSLWLDEAMLALNIVNRSFIGLMQPLDYNQGAPIGFLLIQKLFILVLGNRDWILRLVPLGAGITALILMGKAASIYLSKAGAIIVITLFAISNRLIYYASEAKQYSSDVVITLMLLILVSKCLQVQTLPKHYLALTIGGIAAMWISHPALFTLIGVGSALLIDLVSTKDKSRYPWISILLGVWLANAAILYLFSLRILAANSHLIEYWKNSFMPMPPWREPSWFWNAFLEMFKNPVGLVSNLTAIVGMIISILGIVSFLLDDKKHAILLLAPILVVLLVSGFQKYPFGDRLLLFAVPFVVLLIGKGVEIVRWSLSKVNLWTSLGACLLLGGLLLYQPSKLAFQNLVHPNMGEDIRPVVAYIRQHKLDTDYLYIYYSALPAFTYYASMYGINKESYYGGIISRQEPRKYLLDLERYKTGGRIWFVFSHNCSWCIVDEEKYFVTYLNQVGTKLDEYRVPGASLYLYDIAPTKH